KVDTMHHYREWFNYCENSVLNAKFLELPFEGEDISMIIALPNEKEGLASLENQIEKVFAPQNFTNEFLNVALPKFKVESTLELKSTLKNLGVEKAFNETEADLSGIAGDKGDLVISDALQKTYIDVEEGGVEAAAATYVVVEATMSAPFPPKFEPEPKEFIADHPFIFYIKAKDFIIFAGRVSELSH
ncbi:Serpin domain containing protein, partial [Asbolus verrucosus]